MRGPDGRAWSFSRKFPIRRFSTNIVLSALLAAGAPVAVMAQAASDRADFVASLFTGKEQYENFNRIDALFPTDKVAASDHPEPLETGKAISLPAAFAFDGTDLSTEDFLAATDTAALLVLKDGKIVHETYRLTGGPDVRWLSMSVGKSVVSALVGTAIADGAIKSVDEPVTTYLPGLAGSAYDGVKIKDILQMSSGAQWREEYSDGESDIFRLGALLASGAAISTFPASLKRDHAPGTFNRYNSADTLVLGLLVERATGKRLARYTHEKLWQPIGATSEAFWLTDDEGTAHAYAGFNSTARDYSRIGELYRNGGRWKDKQVIPAEWVQASITPDAPHLVPGHRASADSDWGYGYQWWLPGGDDKQDYAAVGVYNQFIYVNPRSRMVIVKLSANSSYGQSGSESASREAETIAFFRSLAAEY